MSSSQMVMRVEDHLHRDGNEIFAALLLGLHGNYQLAAAGPSEERCEVDSQKHDKMLYTCCGFTFISGAMSSLRISNWVKLGDVLQFNGVFISQPHAELEVFSSC